MVQQKDGNRKAHEQKSRDYIVIERWMHEKEWKIAGQIPPPIK